jgi:ABC-type spermidine/putrescine transport system permease subunit II
LLAPLIVVVVASFSDDPFLVFPPRTLSLRWYYFFFGKHEFTDSLLLSVQLGCVTTA